MNTIDNKVVQMNFDNAQFEKGIATSTQSLQNLDNTLNRMDGKSVKLDKVAQSVKGLDTRNAVNGLNQMGNSVDQMSSKTPGMLSRLGNGLKTLGKVGVGAIAGMGVAVTGLAAHGGIKRALNIEQAVFQLKGMGLDWKEVKQNALDAVNGTAYGLDEAAKVASMFGASGVKAGKDMTNALTAVSGAAAMTGRDYSSIGDIFSTVASNGKLMTMQLRQFSTSGLNVSATLARYFKKVRGESDMTEEKINDMVTKGEIDFKTFSDAMYWAFGKHAKAANELFTGSLANVKAALSRIGADVAATQLTNLRDIFNALIPLIDGVHDRLMPLINAFNEKSTKATEKFVSAIKNLGTFISGGSADKINVMRRVFGSDDKGQKNIKNFKDGLNGIQSALNILKLALDKAKSGMEPFKNVMSSMVRVFLSVFGAVGRLISSFERLLKSQRVLSSIGKTLKSAFQGVINVVTGIAEGFSSLLDSIGSSKANKAKENVSSLSSVFKKFSSISEIVKGTMEGVSKAITKGMEAIGSALTGGNGGGLAALFSGLLVAIGFYMQRLKYLFGKGFLSGAYGIIDNFRKTSYQLSNISENVNGILNGTRRCLEAYQLRIKADALIKIAIAVGILAGSLLVLSSIDGKSLAKGLGALTVVFAELTGVLFAMTKLTAGTGVGKLAVLTWTIQSIATAMVKASVAIWILSKAIDNFAQTIKDLGGTDMEELMQGLMAFGIVLGSVYIATRILSSNSKGMIKSAASLIIFGYALQVMADAVQKLGSIPFNTLVKGLVAVGGLLVALALFMRITDFSGMGLKSGAGILLVAVSLNVLANAVEKMGSLDINTLAKGLGATAASLIIMSGALAVLSKVKGLTKSAVSLLIMSAALKVLADVISDLGNLSLDQIGNSLLALGGSLAIFAVALNLVKGTTSGALSLIILAGALAILTPQLIALSKLSLEQIGMALLAVAGAFAVLGGAALLLGPVAPAMIAVSAAIALLGIGMAAAGAGMMLFATGLTVLATSSAIILAAIPGMVSAIVTFITTLVGQLAKAAPTIASNFAKMLLNMLTVIATYIPRFVDVGASIIVSFIDGISRNLPRLINAGINLIISFINGLADSIRENSDALIDAFGNLMSAVLTLLAKAVSKFIRLGPKYVLGIIKGIGSAIGKLPGAALKIINRLINTLQKGVGKFKQKGAEFIKKLKEGISNKISDVVDTVSKIPGRAVKALSGMVSDFADAGRNAVQGFIDGITGKISDAISAVSGLATKAWNTFKAGLNEHSPSRLFRQAGIWAVQGFVNGIKSYTKFAVASMSDLASDSINSFDEGMKLFNTAISGNLDYTPTIMPIVDLSNVAAAKSYIGGMLSSNPALSVGTAYGMANGISSNLSTNIAREEFAKNQTRISEAIDNLISTNKQTALDPNLIYEAIRHGAADATIKMSLNSRELTRGLKDMGVQFR